MQSFPVVLMGMVEAIKKEAILLFDVDGTLTMPRQVMLVRGII